MNTTIKPAQVQLDRDELKELCSEVKKTIAKETGEAASTSFGQVDIWNIRRSMKTARTMWDK